jgi:hypothetical protein
MPPLLPPEEEEEEPEVLGMSRPAPNLKNQEQDQG